MVSLAESRTGKHGHNAIVPQFPTPEGQTLENWLAVLKNYEEFITPETIFVGHSLGAHFVLNVAERYKIGTAFLVASFFEPSDNQFDVMLPTFTQKPYDWEKIKENCKKFVVIHSDNDPYLKLEKGEKLAKILGVDLILVPGAGHINEAAGFRKFELLLQEILKIKN